MKNQALLRGNLARVTNGTLRLAQAHSNLTITMNLKPAHPHLKSHHPHPSTHATVGRSMMAKRRSNRMALHASVGLSGEDRQKCPFTMPAKATKLNKHGAAVELGRDLPVGTVVTVKNKSGTQISARVVAQLAGLQGISTYAIEFVEQDEKAETFWGITFPPNTSNA
jgi:hypothetical protein